VWSAFFRFSLCPIFSSMLEIGTNGIVRLEISLWYFSRYYFNTEFSKMTGRRNFSLVNVNVVMGFSSSIVKTMLRKKTVF
jgi:hypothetical protein